MENHVLYFILDEREPVEVIMQALREFGAVDVELRGMGDCEGRKMAVLDISTKNTFDLRRVVALAANDLDPREKDEKVVGAAVARAGEWVLEKPSLSFIKSTHRYFGAHPHRRAEETPDT